MTYSEALEIMRNEKHPRHKLYKSGDEATVREIEAAFKAKHRTAEKEFNDVFIK